MPTGNNDDLRKVLRTALDALPPDPAQGPTARKRGTAAKPSPPRAWKPDEKSELMMNSFSKMVMAAVMLMFFVGVGLGIYGTVCKAEPVSVTLDYIIKLALPVGLGYFIKAFGENIAKIVLSAIFGRNTDGGNQ